MSSNSAFISYRRSVSAYLAQSAWRELTDAGIDVFYDIKSIDAGQIDQIILNQIAARPYFIPILTPGTLERCTEPTDWVLHEIQEALRLGRVIVPLVTPEFSRDDFKKYLPSEIAAYLNNANAMEVSPRWFKYAMTELRERFLKPIDIATVPTPKSDEATLAEKQALADTQPEVTDAQLTAQEYFERAYKKYGNRDYDGAIVDYSEVIRLNPRYAAAYCNRGLARADKGDLDAAIADYNQALALDPQDAYCYHNRGLARADKGDLDAAIADYNQALALDPQNAYCYLNRGLTHTDKGDLDAAIADYNQALALDPQNADAYNNRGLIWADKGDFDKAIYDYSQAIRLNPRYSRAYNNRGIARRNKGNLDGAMADYNEALRLNPQNVDAYVNRGVALALKDKRHTTTSIADFDRAIRLDPGHILAYRNRGLAYEGLGARKKAAEDYRRVLELRPDHPHAQTMHDFIKKYGKR